MLYKLLKITLYVFLSLICALCPFIFVKGDYFLYNAESKFVKLFGSIISSKLFLATEALGYTMLLISSILIYEAYSVVKGKKHDYIIERLISFFIVVPIFSVFICQISASSYYGGILGVFLHEAMTYFKYSFFVFGISYLTLITLIGFIFGFQINNPVHYMSLLLREKAGSSTKINKPSIVRKKKIAHQSVLQLDPSIFQLPSTSLLEDVSYVERKVENKKSLEQNSKLLQQVLSDFGIQGKIVNVNSGPVVTLYELEPDAGTKSSRIIGLSDDIARSMSAISSRIAVIPGKNALGIELPNKSREMVYLKELLETQNYQDNSLLLPLILGKTISGLPLVVDLSRMPHLLIAGTTGSGKSVGINTMVLSLLYKYTPEKCKFIMIDPKMLELSVYDGIPHLLTPVVTNPKKAVYALRWVVEEMEKRYKLMSTIGVRNIKNFNKIVEDSLSKGSVLKKSIEIGFDENTGKPIFEEVVIAEKSLPYIVVLVDEMADLMLVAGKEIESYIQRLAQMARAAGIHLIMATQRPSVDVITGVIKANFPTRISFQVTSKIDSRTILGEQGAEQLLGQGDMLYMSTGGKITRVHAPFVSDKEVEDVVNFLKAQGEVEYELTIEDSEIEVTEKEIGLDGSSEAALYRNAVQIVLRDKRTSISYVQRVLKIGYNKAANLVEKMEKEGILSAPNHSGKREIING